jgi:hypothetical protein
MIISDGEVLGICAHLPNIDCTDVVESIKIAKNYMILQPSAEAIKKVINDKKYTSEQELLEALANTTNDYQLHEIDISKVKTLTPAQAIALSSICQLQQD